MKTFFSSGHGVFLRSILLAAVVFGAGGTVSLAQTELVVNVEELVFTETGTRKGFQISQVGPGPLSWSLTADQPWIEILGPLSGTGSDFKQVRILPSIPDGEQLGHVNISSNVGDAVVDILFIPPGGDAGEVGIFGDAAGVACSVLDSDPQLIELFVVHHQTVGMGGLYFAAPKPPCMVGAVYIGDTRPFTVNIGDSQSGIAIAFGACISDPVHVLTVNYFGQGTTTPCCAYGIVPAPDEIQIVVGSCTGRELAALPAAELVINPDASCDCATVPTEEMTWGAVKSLYAQ